MVVDQSTNHVNYVGQCLFVKFFKRLLTFNFVNSHIFCVQNSITFTARKAVA